MTAEEIACLIEGRSNHVHQRTLSAHRHSLLLMPSGEPTDLLTSLGRNVLRSLQLSKSGAQPGACARDGSNRRWKSSSSSTDGAQQFDGTRYCRDKRVWGKKEGLRINLGGFHMASTSEAMLNASKNVGLLAT